MEQDKQKKSLRPEAVMAVIALVCLVGLIVVVALCVPHFTQASDPESLLQHIREEEQNREEVDPLEPTEEFVEETTEPTIPPEANPYSKWDFQYDRSNYLYCTRQDSFPGIDVSSFQGEIDWKQVKQSGIRFAMIRLGYRGYTEGGLRMDSRFEENIRGALEAGLEVGVYFFSQAITPGEAEEEAEFVLEALEGYELAYPVAFDWEPITPGKEARTDALDGETLTQCAAAFCRRVSQAGYVPQVYFNKELGYLVYDLAELKDWSFWLAEYDTAPDFYYGFDLWQYTHAGSVAGIQGNVDLDLDLRSVLN